MIFSAKIANNKLLKNTVCSRTVENYVQKTKQKAEYSTWYYPLHKESFIGKIKFEKKTS